MTYGPLIPEWEQHTECATNALSLNTDQRAPRTNGPSTCPETTFNASPPLSKSKTWPTPLLDLRMVPLSPSIKLQKLHVSNLPTPVQPKLGKHWVSRFLARNPVLQSKLAKNIEAARKEVTEAQLENWFNEFKRVVDEFGILPENIYNMDETGSNSWTLTILTTSRL